MLPFLAIGVTLPRAAGERGCLTRSGGVFQLLQKGGLFTASADTPADTRPKLSPPHFSEVAGELYLRT